MACIAQRESYPLSDLFCEGKYGGIFMGFVAEKEGVHLPEWGNCISALVGMGFMGIYQLVAWDHDSPYIRFCSALFVVNGWGSCLAHSTATVWWGFVDGMSIVTVSYMVFGLVLEELGGAIRQVSEPTVEAVKTAMSDVKDPSHPYAVKPLWLRLGRACIYVSATSAVWLFYVQRLEDCAMGHISTFSGFFEVFGLGFPVVVVICILVYQFCRLQKTIAAAPVDMRRAWARLVWGIAASAVASVVWVATEQGCDSYVFFRWFPGHILWHTLMPYGLMQVLQFVVFTRARTSNCIAKFDTPAGDRATLYKVYRFFFPKLVFTNVAECGNIC